MQEKPIKEQLIQAVKQNDLTALKQLIESGADINTKNSFQENLLFQAAQYGHVELVVYLLENHADIQQRNSGKQNVLDVACIKGHFEIVKILLHAGLNPHQINGTRAKLPIALAYKYNHVDIVRYFVQENLINDDERSTLYAVINSPKQPNIECLDLIVTQHHEITDQDIQLLFSKLLFMSSLDGMEYLLQKFPQIKTHYADYFEDLLFDYSAEHAPLRCYLTNHYKHYAVLAKYDYAFKFNLSQNNKVLFLLQHGFQFTDYDKMGHTLLHFAAKTIDNEYEDISHIASLLIGGFPIDILDAEGKTPLHVALENGLFFHAIGLIVWGADVTAKDSHGETVHDKIARFCVDGLEPDRVENREFQQELFNLLK